MSEYMECLAESTSSVKSKKCLSKTILITSYLGIWVLALIMFWFFTGPTDAMGYSIMFLWIILPVTTFVVSLMIGKNGYWGNWKWFATLAFGVMYMLAEYGTFGIANMLAFRKVNMPDFDMIVVGAVISAIGLGIGTITGRVCFVKKQN